MLYKVHHFLFFSFLWTVCTVVASNTELPRQNNSSLTLSSSTHSAELPSVPSNGQDRPPASASITKVPTAIASAVTTDHQAPAPKVAQSSPPPNSSTATSATVILAEPGSGSNEIPVSQRPSSKSSLSKVPSLDSSSSSLDGAGIASKVANMLNSSIAAAISASLVAATLPTLVTSQPSLITAQPSIVTSMPPIVSLNSVGLPTTLTSSSTSDLSSLTSTGSSKSSTGSTSESRSDSTTSSIASSVTKSPTVSSSKSTTGGTVSSTTRHSTGTSTRRPTGSTTGASTRSHPSETSIFSRSSRNRSPTRPPVSPSNTRSTKPTSTHPRNSSTTSTSHHSTTHKTTRHKSTSHTSTTSSTTSSSTSSSSTTSSSSSTTSTSSSSSSSGSFNVPPTSPGSPSGGPTASIQSGPTGPTAQPSQSTAPAPVSQSQNSGLTSSAIAGISAGSVSGALIVAVAGLFLARRCAGNRRAATAGNQVYPEEAYLYDPPMPQVIMAPPPPPDVPQLPPVRTHPPFGSTSNLAPGPAGEPRGSFESVDLSTPYPGFMGGPVGAGNTDSYGGISAHDWAIESAAATAAARGGPDPFADPMLHPIDTAGPSAAQRPRTAPHADQHPIYDHPASSVSAFGSTHSLPSPVSRVLEEHGHDPRPLHPLEREEMELERKASVSTLGASDDGVEPEMQEQQLGEHSPLMERAAGPAASAASSRPREEMWMGADGYQRVETNDV